MKAPARPRAFRIHSSSSSPARISGDATGVKRTETAVHVQAVYLVNPGGKLRMAFSGGPTFFNLEQDLVTEVTVTEAYPYDTVTFAAAEKRTAKADRR